MNSSHPLCPGYYEKISRMSIPLVSAEGIVQWESVVRQLYLFLIETKVSYVFASPVYQRDNAPSDFPS